MKKKLERIRPEELQYPDRQIPQHFQATISAVTVLEEKNSSNRTFRLPSS